MVQSSEACGPGHEQGSSWRPTAAAAPGAPGQQAPPGPAHFGLLCTRPLLGVHTLIGWQRMMQGLPGPKNAGAGGTYPALSRASSAAAELETRQRGGFKQLRASHLSPSRACPPPIAGRPAAAAPNPVQQLPTRCAAASGGGPGTHCGPLAAPCRAQEVARRPCRFEADRRPNTRMATRCLGLLLALAAVHAVCGASITQGEARAGAWDRGPILPPRRRRPRRQPPPRFRSRARPWRRRPALQSMACAPSTPSSRGTSFSTLPRSWGWPRVSAAAARWGSGLPRQLRGAAWRVGPASLQLLVAHAPLRAPDAAAPRPRLPAGDLEAASKACGLNTTNLQIGMNLCLPGYDPANCKFVVQTGERVPSAADSGSEAEQGAWATVAARAGTRPAAVRCPPPPLAGLAHPAALPALRFPPAADPDRPFCQVYTFQLGDTLKTVADKFGTTEEKLIELNSGGWRGSCW